jgi:pyrroloquinoline quinone biosynthesis protein D
MLPIPRRRTDLAVSELAEGRETVLLDAKTEKVVSLNSTAAAIWYLCDGQRSLDDIVEEVASVWCEMDRAVLTQDVSRAVSFLQQHHLLDVGP